MRHLVIAALLTVGRLALCQSPNVVNGRVLNGAGRGMPAAVSAKSSVDSAILASGRADETGVFRLTLGNLPAQMLLEAVVGRDDVVRRLVDSASVRRSSTTPIILRSGKAQELARVEVRVKPQRRPSVFTYFEGEAASRTEQAGGATTDWLDPMTLGTAADLLRVSPELMQLPGAGSNLLGAPGNSNQVQLGGMRVPREFVSGDLGGTVSYSPWDVTVGGAAGANVNLFLGSGGRFRASRVDIRSGVSGVPAGSVTARTAPGVSVPFQLSGSTSGPLGSVRYSARVFASLYQRRMSPWIDALDEASRSAVDRISEQLGQPTILRSGGRSQVGLVGRVDLRPGDMKHVRALTAAISGADDHAGSKALYQAASVLGTRRDYTGVLQLEDTKVLRDRVLWSSLFGASASTVENKRPAAGPTVIILSPASGGGFVIAGAAPPVPRTAVQAVEGKSTATWYSANNARRFVTQLQVRAEQDQQGARSAHGTFVAVPGAPSSPLQVLGYERSGSRDDSRASVILVAAAVSVRQDLNKSGSLLVGVRTDAWQTSRLRGSGALSALDISPRIALLRRVHGRSRTVAPVATLRIGAGRFVDWPDLVSWSDTWNGGGAQGQQCAYPVTPVFAVTQEDPVCPSATQSRETTGTLASRSLRPVSATRADASASLNTPSPNWRVELGVATARTDRIATTLSPIVSMVPVGKLLGDGGRATYVGPNQISIDGTVPLSPIATGSGTASLRAAVGWSEATQLRARLATRDPFALVQLDARYVYTMGRERDQVTASAGRGTALVTAPLTAAGRHTVAFSAGMWASDIQVKLTAMLRSGPRFTPIADRDLNGDGVANDPVFVPRELAGQWASAVPAYLRNCIRQATGTIAGISSCTGPWSLQTQLVASINGRRAGLAPGSAIDVHLGNPLSLFLKNGSDRLLRFGDVVAVNPTLLHVTGFDPVLQRFTGTPLSNFGTSRGLVQGTMAPVQLTINVRIPLGRSVTDQRAAEAIRILTSDRSPRGRQAAAMQYLSDIPPIPLMVLQSAEVVQLTAAQRGELQKLGSRWQDATLRVVTIATSDDTTRKNVDISRAQLFKARDRFMQDVIEIASATRRVLTPDQTERLPESIQRLLNPRFLRLVASFDAGM